MAAMKRSAVVELFWKIHPFLYRMSGGRLLGRMVGLDVLLLTTRGARSGQLRTTALTFVPHADARIVVGSFLGEPRHPGWVHNLRANPRAEIQIGSKRIEVVAREAEGEEREQLWKAVIAAQPDYSEYEHRTGRVIPLVVLEAAASDSA
jgi:deazaflavin-dependent oxidoreductase (nitroreductase family)